MLVVSNVSLERVEPVRLLCMAELTPRASAKPILSKRNRLASFTPPCSSPRPPGPVTGAMGSSETCTSWPKTRPAYQRRAARACPGRRSTRTSVPCCSSGCTRSVPFFVVACPPISSLTRSQQDHPVSIQIHSVLRSRPSLLRALDVVVGVIFLVGHSSMRFFRNKCGSCNRRKWVHRGRPLNQRLMQLTRVANRLAAATPTSRKSD